MASSSRAARRVGLSVVVALILQCCSWQNVNGFVSTSHKKAVQDGRAPISFRKSRNLQSVLPSKPGAVPSTSQLFQASSSSAALFGSSKKLPTQSISKLSALFTKMGMMAFIISMCIALPIALLPQALLHKMGWISRIRMNQLALSSGQFCARWLLRLIPFCHVTTKRVEFETADKGSKEEEQPEPSIWVCNHTSALDIFMLLAKDKALRGGSKKKRPIKIVYVSTSAHALGYARIANDFSSFDMCFC